MTSEQFAEWATLSILRPNRPLLRTQLLRWLLFPLFVLLAVDTAISLVLSNHFSKNAYDKALIEIGYELSLQVRKVDARTVLDLPEVASRLLLQDTQDILYFELLNRQGQRIAGEPIPTPPANATVFRKDVVLYDAQRGTTAVRVVELRLPEFDEATLRVAETTVKRTEVTQQIIASVLIPQIILIILVALLVPFGVTRGLKPLKALQRAIAERSFRDRSALDEANVPGEVVPLVTSINALLERLDTVLSAQSRFVADAAHQLKTPVSALRAYVELLARTTDEEERVKIVSKLNAAVDRMSRVTSQLLTLAQTDLSEAKSPDFERIDLNVLLLDICTHWVPQALKKGVDLGFEAYEVGAQATGIDILGAQDRLRELFDNLIDNAIRYSSTGGSVTVRVLAQPSPAISIRDDAPSIPETERTLVFDRFYRRLGSGEGSGLGLAIAKDIATMHRASITLGDDVVDGIGHNVLVTFPLIAAIPE